MSDDVNEIHFEAREKDDFLYYYLVSDSPEFEPKLILTLWMGAARQDPTLIPKCNALLTEHVDRVFGAGKRLWADSPAKRDS